MNVNLYRIFFLFPLLLDVEDNTCGLAKHVESHVSPLVAPYDVRRITQKSVKLSDAEKIQFLDDCWQPAASSAFDTQWLKARKEITFQTRWLAHSAHNELKGGWCVSCLLFLTDGEKEALGVFVKKLLSETITNVKRKSIAMKPMNITRDL